MMAQCTAHAQLKSVYGVSIGHIPSHSNFLSKVKLSAMTIARNTKIKLHGDSSLSRVRACLYIKLTPPPSYCHQMVFGTKQGIDQCCYKVLCSCRSDSYMFSHAFILL